MATTKVQSELIADDVALAGNPTTTTQGAGNNTTRIATTAFVTTAINNLINSAPGTLDTLDEIAAALNDDPSFTTTVNNAIATKLPLAGGTMTGALIVVDGSTSVPSIGNSGDTNTGIYFPADDQLGLVVGGSRKLLASSTGIAVNNGDLVVDTSKFVVDVSASSVGIGTASPSDELHISADNPAIRFDDTDGGYGRVMGVNGAIYYQADEGANGASSFHRWDVAGTDNQMRLSTDGLALNSTATDGSRFYVKVPDSDTVSSALKLSQNNAAGNDRNTLSIKCDGPNNLAIFNSSGTSSGGYAYNSGGTERMRLTAAGRMILGHNASISNGVASKLQIYNAGAEGSLSLGRWGAVTSPPYLTFMKSRGANVGDNTILNDNDIIGEIRWRAADGVNFNAEAGAIHCRVDGTPGADDMPGELHFQTTASGADSATSKMIIKPNGNVGIGTADAQTLLELSAHNASGQNTLRFTDEDTGTAADQTIGKIEFYTKDGSGDGASVRAYILGAAQDATPSTYIAFATCPGSSSPIAEVMRIDKDGHVGIGTLTPGHPLHIVESADGPKIRLTRGGTCEWDFSIGDTSTLTGVGSGALELLPQNANTANEFAIGTAGSTAALFHLTNSYIRMPSLNQTGSTSNRYPLYWVHTGNTGSLEPYTGSIRAMKTDIADMSSVDWIHSLTPRSFKFRDYTTDSEGNRTYLETTNDLPDTEYGLIAEEVDEVNGSDYILDKDTDNNVKGVLYHNLVPILLKSVQELKTELDAAKARIKTLEDT